MKTIIFIKDVIERLPNKTTYVQAIASAFGKELSNITDQKFVEFEETCVSIGGCDSLGRCNIKTLDDTFKKADIIIMTAIGGSVEYSVINRKDLIYKEDYDVIIITPPQIRRTSDITDNDLSSLFGCYIKRLVAHLIHSQSNSTFHNVIEPC